MTAWDSDPGIAMVAMASIQAVLRTNGTEVDMWVGFTHSDQMGLTLVSDCAQPQPVVHQTFSFQFWEMLKKLQLHNLDTLM
jgi:hypothetical protein